MQTQIFSYEWGFQLTVMLILISGFALTLCIMELAVCIWAELKGQRTDLPTQESVHRFFMRIRLALIRRRRRKAYKNQPLNNLITKSYDQDTSHIGTRRGRNLARTDQARRG